MNLKKLQQAERAFFARYPGGFDDEELKHIGKRHNVGKLSEFAAQNLAKKNFRQQAAVLDSITRIVSRSSMLSMFEKPKFRDYVNGLSRDDRSLLADGFNKLLHGNQTKGFEAIGDILLEGQLAKWSLMTICLYQLYPQKEVFVKPTTTKNVIRQFELEHLTYHPRPTWQFYKDYREAIDEMKSQVHPSLSPNNAAFTGFLMMSTATS
ncbi:MAG: hypothetical protein NXH95_06270 [Pseudomonadaceae bacterium]|nr:hypothetical protein [Pseudomonadaceae bacterium]